MGVLTDDLTRLRNEILALRGARQGLMHDLEEETGDRRADVSQMLADFSKGFGAVARRTKANRLGSISDLKRTVTDLLTEVRTDLSGIRQAWRALGTPSRRAVEELENQARLRAGANAEGGRSQTGGKRPLVLVGGEKPVRKKRKH
jgi:hypothetical protein